jgi:hypothetical protein
MTYAFLYMGRYNLNVCKNALGSLMTKEDFGLIFAAGTVTYALSFLVNGPLVDKIGGKKGIIIAAIGSLAGERRSGCVDLSGRDRATQAQARRGVFDHLLAQHVLSELRCGVDHQGKRPIGSTFVSAGFRARSSARSSRLASISPSTGARQSWI